MTWHPISLRPALLALPPRLLHSLRIDIQFTHLLICLFPHISVTCFEPTAVYRYCAIVVVAVVVIGSRPVYLWKPNFPWLLSRGGQLGLGECAGVSVICRRPQEAMSVGWPLRGLPSSGCDCPAGRRNAAYTRTHTIRTDKTAHAEYRFVSCQHWDLLVDLSYCQHGQNIYVEKDRKFMKSSIYCQITFQSSILTVCLQF